MRIAESWLIEGPTANHQSGAVGFGDRHLKHATFLYQVACKVVQMLHGVAATFLNATTHALANAKAAVETQYVLAPRASLMVHATLTYNGFVERKVMHCSNSAWHWTPWL
jgi:hypothetical protein